jgi:hypothetical protein
MTDVEKKAIPKQVQTDICLFLSNIIPKISGLSMPLVVAPSAKTISKIAKGPYRLDFVVYVKGIKTTAILFYTTPKALKAHSSHASHNNQSDPQNHEYLLDIFPDIYKLDSADSLKQGQTYKIHIQKGDQSSTQMIET